MKLELDYRIKRYAKDDIHFKVNTSYALDAGILGVFGKSGTGKTSFLKAIAGLTSDTAYRIELDAITYSNIAAANNPCVYVGADSVLFDHIDVLANLTLVVKHSLSASQRCLDIDEVIHLCAIEHLLAQPIAALSSGERQRVIFARALLSGKKLLLLDEAFSALDWSARLYFIELIKKLKHQYDLRFILVSHSLKELALLCKHIWVLQEGCFVLQADVNTALDMMLLSDSKIQAYSESLFSVLDLKYLQDDALDAHLQVWQLLAVDAADAQTIFIRRSAQTQIEKMNASDKSILTSFVIDANRISLSYDKPTQTSMLNCIRGEVASIHDVGSGGEYLPSGVMIKLSVNGQALRALISKRSFIDMQIKIGDQIFALFKAI
jgi:molybdate transport system ATP-binding protein